MSARYFYLMWNCVRAGLIRPGNATRKNNVLEMKTILEDRDIFFFFLFCIEENTLPDFLAIL